MKIHARLLVWTFAVAVVTLPALSVQAALWCTTACDTWPAPCCSRACWNNYWTTCGDEGFWCNPTCRSEQPNDARSGDVSAAPDAALLRALLPQGCTAASTSASPIAPAS